MASLFGLGAKRPDPQPPNAVARYACTKHSWRGRYRRILVLTVGGLATLDPGDFKLTNQYSLGADPDVEGVSLGAGNDEDGEIIINARGDKKVAASILQPCMHMQPCMHLLHEHRCMQHACPTPTNR